MADDSKSDNSVAKWSSFVKDFVTSLEEAWYGKDKVRKGVVATALFLFLAVGTPNVPQWILSKERLDLVTRPFWLLALLSFLVTLFYLAKKRKSTPSPTALKAVKWLASYEFEDADLFRRLKRDEPLTEFYNALVSSEFRIGYLLGQTGSGKTSFLRAGLQPLLLKEGYLVILVKCDNRPPLEALKQVLRSPLRTDKDSITLSEEVVSLTNLTTLLARIQQETKKRVVLVFDQFEQFFVHGFEETKKKAFYDALDYWRKNGATNSKLVFCLREDFAGRMTDIEQAIKFTPQFNHKILLKKFDREAAAAVLFTIAEEDDLKPDRRFIETTLIPELMDKHEKTVLPADIQILAWVVAKQADAEKRVLNETTYRAMNGIDGLLESYLRDAQGDLTTPERKKQMLSVLLTMIDLTTNLRKQPMSQAEIEQECGKGDMTLVLKFLTDQAQLLTKHEAEGDSPEKYELKHERLIALLLKMANQQQEGAEQVKTNLVTRSKEWETHNQNRRYLLSAWEWWQVRKYGLHVSTDGITKKLIRASTKRVGIWSLVFGCGLVFSIGGRVWWSGPQGQIWQVKRDYARYMDTITEPELQQWKVPTLVSQGDFDKALQIVESITDPSFKSSALRSIAGELSKSSPDKALQIAESITDPSAKSNALRSIAGELSKLPLDKALRIAESITAPDAKSSALRSIAGELSKLPPDKASPLFDKALQIAESITAPRFKSDALSGIAGELSKLPLDKALQRAESITDPYVKSSALSSIAGELSKSSPDKASPLFDKAVKIAESIADPSAKSSVLRSIVGVGSLRDVLRTNTKLRGTLLTMVNNASNPSTKQHLAYLCASVSDYARARSVTASTDIVRLSILASILDAKAGRPFKSYKTSFQD